MLGAVALLGAAALPARLARAAGEPDSPTAPNAIPPEDALQRLKDGNGRYAADNRTKQEDYSVGRAGSAGTQYPIAAVLACSDSRVPPEIVFDQGPGDIFAVRVAGNIVTEEGLASLEYAFKFLGVPLLMVLGHANCGAVDAALAAVTGGKELPGHLPDLVKAIEPAVVAAHGRHPGDLLTVAIEENVRLSVKRLLEGSEILADALNDKKVAVSGGIYDLATGQVRLI
jgi:carbonic anhydrase